MTKWLHVSAINEPTSGQFIFLMTNYIWEILRIMGCHTALKPIKIQLKDS
jgi:hypothetical protein